jgi:hypothetical protein
MVELKQVLRNFGVFAVRHFGSKVVDQKSGQLLGRALFLPWSGKIHVIGLEATVLVSFLPQERLTYWKQEIGFTIHPSPDFPRGVVDGAEQKSM